MLWLSDVQGCTKKTFFKTRNISMFESIHFYIKKALVGELSFKIFTKFDLYGLLCFGHEVTPRSLILVKGQGYLLHHS